MKCSICGKEIKGHGNNPWPIKNSKDEYLTVEERCCDECNDKYVTPARFAHLLNNEADIKLIDNQVRRLRGDDAESVKTVKHLIAVIERPDGSTYDQEITYLKNDTVESAKERAQSKLGNKYRFYTDKRGYRHRVLNSRCYLIVGTYFREDVK